MAEDQNLDLFGIVDRRQSTINSRRRLQVQTRP
jgi:hypothetical protein